MTRLPFLTYKLESEKKPHQNQWLKSGKSFQFSTENSLPCAHRGKLCALILLKVKLAS